MFKHSHVGSCCAPGPCPGSHLPSPNEGTCQPGQRPRPPVRWEMLEAGWEVGSPPRVPLSIPGFSTSPLGWWHHRVLTHGTWGSQLLSLGVKLEIPIFFWPVPPSQRPPHRAAPASVCWKQPQCPVFCHFEASSGRIAVENHAAASGASVHT